MGSSPFARVDEFLRLRAEHWPEADTPITQLMVRLFRLSDRVVAEATSCVARYGLTFTEFEVLAALRSSPPPHALQPTDLYAAILISSGGLTKVLYGLGERGLVVRDTGGTDRRSKPVRLTSKGRATAERVMADVLSTDRERVSKALSKGEVGQLIRLLAKLLTAWELSPETD